MRTLYSAILWAHGAPLSVLLLVSTPQSPVERMRALSVARDLSIALPIGERSGRVLLGPDRGIFVVRGRALEVFSSTGSLVRRFVDAVGGSTQRIVSAGFLGDTLWVSAGQDDIRLLAASGQIARRILVQPLQLPGGQPYSATIVGAVRDGSVLGARVTNADDPGGSPIRLSLFRMTTDGKALNDLDWRPTRRGALVQHVLGASGEWVPGAIERLVAVRVSSDCSSIASAESFVTGPIAGTVEVTTRDATGATRYTARIKVRLQPLPRDSIEAAIARLSPPARPGTVDQLRRTAPPFYPPLQDALVARSHAALLVLRRSGSSQKIVIVDSAGAIRGTATLPSNLEIVAFEGDSFLTRSRQGATEVISRYRVLRSSAP